MCIRIRKLYSGGIPISYIIMFNNKSSFVMQSTQICYFTEIDFRQNKNKKHCFVFNYMDGLIPFVLRS